MKKIIIFLSLIICTCISTCFASGKKVSHNIESQKLNVVFDGKNYDGANIYKISDSNFLSLKEIATLFDARLDWQSVSGKVSMKLKNKSVDIFVNSKKISFGKKKEKLNIPTLLLNNEVYIPVELLLLKDFSEIFENVITFDSK
ncbi:MAG: stalk domain-containing protein, partial [Endomicrobiia bacterium]